MYVPVGSGTFVLAKTKIQSLMFYCLVTKSKKNCVKAVLYCIVAQLQYSDILLSCSIKVKLCFSVQLHAQSKYSYMLYCLLFCCSIKVKLCYNAWLLNQSTTMIYCLVALTKYGEQLYVLTWSNKAVYSNIQQLYFDTATTGKQYIICSCTMILYDSATKQNNTAVL